jgi:hypothetical protein
VVIEGGVGGQLVVCEESIVSNTAIKNIRLMFTYGIKVSSRRCSSTERQALRWRARARSGIDTYFLCCTIICLMLKTLGHSLILILLSVSIAISALPSGDTPMATVSCYCPNRVFGTSSSLSSCSLPLRSGMALTPSYSSLSIDMNLTSPTLSLASTPLIDASRVSAVTAVTSVNFFLSQVCAISPGS